MVRIPVTLADFDKGRIRSSISKLSKHHPDQPAKPKLSLVQQTFAQILGYGGYEELLSQAKKNGPSYFGQSLAIEQFITPISIRISRYWSVSADKAESVAAALGLIHLDAFRPTVRTIQQPLTRKGRVGSSESSPSVGLSPTPIFDAVRRATLVPIAHLAELQDAMKPMAELAAFQNALKPMTYIAALQDALRPLAELAAFQDALKPSAELAALQDALKPSAEMAALQVALKPSADLAALQDAMKPMAHIAALQDSMKPSAELAALQDALKPMTHLATLQDALKPMTHLATLQDALKDSTGLSAIEDAMKPMAHINAILDVLRPTRY